MNIVDVVSQKYNISKRLVKKYLREGKIEYNGRVVKKGIDIFDPSLLKLKISLRVEEFDLKDFLIEDFGDVVFLYKPPFMHTVRHRLEDKLTVEDVVNRYFSGYFLISRLDFETDGVIAAVKDGVKIHFIKKVYYAVVVGELKGDRVLKNRIDYRKRKKVRVLEDEGDDATFISPLKHCNGYTLVRVELEKAKRHQIRAYLSYLGYPIVGDRLYGDFDYRRMMLSSVFTAVNDFGAKSPFKEMFVDEFYRLK